MLKINITNSHRIFVIDIFHVPLINIQHLLNSYELSDVHFDLELLAAKVLPIRPRKFLLYLKVAKLTGKIGIDLTMIFRLNEFSVQFLVFEI